MTAVAPDGEWPFLRGQASARDCQTLCWALTAVGPCVCLYACEVGNDIFGEVLFIVCWPTAKKVLKIHKNHNSHKNKYQKHSNTPRAECFG